MQSCRCLQLPQQQDVTNARTNPMPDSAIRVETAEVTAITSENAISGGRIIGETQAVK